MLTLDGLLIRQEDFELKADFSIDRGGRVAVIGPSGAGKSTLLNTIAGYFEPTLGAVIWDGRDITGLKPGKRPIAMLFQDNNLFPHLSVEQNVGLGINPSLRLTTAQKSDVAAALSRVGLDGFGHRKPGKLSGGQQSRAALARVLVQRKPLMLLDEPFSALGPALKNEMLDLVAELAAEIDATVLMVSHDPGDAERFAQAVVLVADGQAEVPVTIGELMENPPVALRKYLGS